MSACAGVFVVCPSLRGLPAHIERCAYALRDAYLAEAIDCPLPTRSSKCPLYMARSCLADDFLKWSHSRAGGGSDDDVYFSFDDDTEFRLEDALAVIGTVLAGKSDFSGASYTERNLNPKAFREACKDDTKTWDECVEDGANYYCGYLPLAVSDKKLRGFIHEQHQFIATDWVGGGLFAMSRRAIEALLSAYPGMMLFDNAINKDGIWQSDDIVIGNRFKAIGGQSYLDVDSRLVHWGSFGYRTALDRHLKEQGFAYDNSMPPQMLPLDTRVHVDAARLARHDGIKLRYRREQAGLTREQLADAVSLPPSQVERIESGEMDPEGPLVSRWLDACKAR